MQSPPQQSWNRNGELQTEPAFFKEGFKKIEMLCKRGLHLKTENLQCYELKLFLLQYPNQAILKMGGWCSQDVVSDSLN